MSAADVLKEELAVYERHKDELLRGDEGRFALIGDGAVSSAWDTYEDALQAGYGKFGLKPFLVKQIAALERVHFVSPASPKCQH
jgi:hypothetical protein